MPIEQTTPDKAKEIGCDPEMFYPYWIDRLQVKEKARGAGAHIHFGWTKDKQKGDLTHEWDCRHLAEYCAAWWAMFCHKIDPNHSLRIRDTGYGRLGSYRIKPYGMEYRSPSSAWLGRPDIHEWMFVFFSKVFKFAQNMEKPCRVFGHANDRVFHRGEWLDSADYVHRNWPEVPRLPNAWR